MLWYQFYPSFFPLTKQEEQISGDNNGKTVNYKHPCVSHLNASSSFLDSWGRERLPGLPAEPEPPTRLLHQRSLCGNAALPALLTSTRRWQAAGLPRGASTEAWPWGTAGGEAGGALGDRGPAPSGSRAPVWGWAERINAWREGKAREAPSIPVSHIPPAHPAHPSQGTVAISGRCENAAHPPNVRALPPLCWVTRCCCLDFVRGDAESLASGTQNACLEWSTKSAHKRLSGARTCALRLQVLRSADGALSPGNAALPWVTQRAAAGRCRQDDVGTGGAAANRPGRREAATDGSCQQGTNSKNRGTHDRNYTERGKKKTLNISYVLVSSFQLKENLLSNDQRNSTAKADGEHPCGAIRAGWGVPSIKNYCMACWDTALCTTCTPVSVDLGALKEWHHFCICMFLWLDTLCAVCTSFLPVWLKCWELCAAPMPKGARWVGRTGKKHSKQERLKWVTVSGHSIL